VESAAGTIASFGESIKTFLSTLINIGSFDKNGSHENAKENAITWILKNLDKLSAVWASQKSIGDETKNRVKRDAEASNSEVSRTKPHLGGISKHVLKLSEGSTSNVLKSEKATVAEALNGRAAIRKILARAKVKAAQAAQHRGRFYDDDDFSKWLLSGSSFDANIFRHHRRRRPLHNAKMAGYPETETSDDNDDDSDDFPTFAVSRHMSAKPMNHQHRHQEMERTFNSDATIGAADSDRSYTKLRHKSKRRKYPLPELEISRGGERGHETNGILYTSPRMHKSREEAESVERRYVPSHARIPHSRFRVTEDEETENGVPKWKHAEWMHALHSAGSFEFDTADEKEDYKRRYLFETSFDEPELELDGSEYARHRKWHEILPGIGIHDGINTDDDETMGTSDSHGRAKLGRKWYRYDFGDRKHSAYNEDAIDFANAEKQWHSASSVELERASSINSRGEGDTGDEGKYRDVDAVERSAIIRGTSAEMMGGGEKKQSANMLIKRISTDTPTRKPVNIDSEHYRTRDRSVAANSATSFSSSLSDEKGSRHTNNVPASPSVDDGSAVVKTKTENDRATLGRARAVIDNDATSAEIEMGFREIKDYPSVDSPSVSRASSRTHLEDQRDHRDNVASSEAKPFAENRNKTRDLKEDQIENTVSSREVTTSVEGEHQRDLFGISSSSDSREEDYVRSRKRLASPRRTAPRHRTSIEVIDIEDRNAQVLLPEFPVLEFGKKRMLHDIGYYDPDARARARADQEIEIDESAGDSRSGELDYDDPDEKEEFATNAGISQDSEAIVSDELDRQGEHRKSDTHMERYDNKINQNKFQLNQHDFHQRTRDVTSSSIVWNATRFATWEEYLYFIREQKQKSNALNVPVELSASFAGKKNKERNNVMDGEISPLDERGEKHMTDEDNHVYVKEHESIPGLIAQSTGINEITTPSTGRQGETEMRNTSDQSKNRKIVTFTESLGYNGSMLGTTSQAASSKITIDSNVHRQDDSWESLNNSRVDVQAEAERVYGTRGGNKNTDVIATQAAETAQSTDPKSNLERVSPETSASESDNTEKMVASEQDERVFSPDEMIGYIHHDDSREASASSVSAVKSQMEVKHHLSGQSKNGHGIDTETLTARSNDPLDEFGSNAPNTAASSGSSAESRIGLLKHEADVTDNKGHDADADATISISVKNHRASTSSSAMFSTSFAKEEINNLNRSTSTEVSATNLQALLTAAVSSPESATRTEKEERRLNVSGNAQMIINAETSSTMSADVLKNEESISSSEIGYHLTDQRKSKADAIRKAEGMHPNAMEDRHRSHLQESISSSSVESSQTSQANSDDYRDSRRNVLTAENIDVTSRMVAPFFNAIKDDHQQQAGSLSSSTSSAENEDKANASMSMTISDDITAISQRNLIGASSLQISTNDLNARNDDSTSNVATLSIKNDKDGQENNKLHAKWLIDPRNKVMRKFANDEHIERVKFVNQDTGEALNVAASARTVPSTDIKSARNSAMSSLSIDGATGTWLRHGHNLDQAKERKTPSDDSVISKASSENEDNYKAELLEASSLLHNNASEERSKHRTENYRKSMVTVKAPSESVLSRSKERSRDDLVERISGEAQGGGKNFDMSENRSEETARKMTTEIMSNSISVAHWNNLSKDMSVIWNERVQTNERVNDKNEINTANSNTEDEADFQGQAKDLISKSSTKGTALASSSIKGDNRDDLLKVRASDNLHTATFQDDKRKLDVLSDPEEINNVVTTSREIRQDYEGNLQGAAFLRNLQDKMLVENESNLRKLTIIDDNKELTEDNLRDATSFNEVQEKKHGNMRNVPKKSVKNIIDMLVSTKIVNGNITDESRRELSDNSQNITGAQNKARWESTSSVNAETQSDIDRESSILKKTEVINSEIRNNINKWRAESRTSFSSSLFAGLQNEEQTVVETGASAESIGGVVNDDAHKDELVRASFLFGPLKIARVSNDRNRSDQRTNVENIRGAKSETSSSNVSKIEHQDDNVKGTIPVALHSRQHDLNVQTKDKAIISNVPLSTDGTGSSEMHNARQKSLDIVTSSNSRAETQHGQGISDIAKENWEIAGNAATSAILSGKVTGESREKLITSWSGFNSFANARQRGSNDPNILQKEKEVTATSAETSTNSAISRNWENARWPMKKNYESMDLDSDAYAEDENRNVSQDNVADAADATASEADRHVIRDKQQSDVTAEGWTRHEYDSSFQRESAGLIRSDDAKDRVAESKNTLNNAKQSLKAATHTVMSTDATSSADVGNASKLADPPKILSSSDISCAESEMYNAASRDGQDALASTSSISAARNAKNQRGIENNEDGLKEDPYNGKNAATSGQPTDLGDVKKEKNLLKATSSAILFANAQRMQQRERESNVFKEHRLVTADSTASSDSRIFEISSGTRKDLEELTGTASSDSYARSSAQSENHAQVRANHANTLTSESTDATISEMLIKNARQEESSFHIAKDENVINVMDNSMNENSDINAKTKPISFSDARTVDSRLLNLLSDAAMSVRAKDERISQKDAMTEELSKQSAGLASAAHNSKISNGNYEDPAMMTKIESNLLDDQQNVSYKVKSPSGVVRDSQRDIESTSLANSRAITQLVNQSTARSENIKTNRKEIVNSSILDEAGTYSKVKGTDPNDWPVAKSGIAALAEERAQKKERSNSWKEAEQAAVYAETSARAAPATSASEQRDVCAEDSSRCQDGRDAAKNILDVVVVPDASGEVASTGAGNKNENKSWVNGMAATSSSSDDAHAETRTIDEGRHGVSRGPGFPVDAEETGATSFASIFDNVNVHLGRRYHQINDETSLASTVTAASKNIEQEVQVPLIETSLHPPQEACDENARTREFISAASSLYKVSKQCIIKSFH